MYSPINIDRAIALLIELQYSLSRKRERAGVRGYANANVVRFSLDYINQHLFFVHSIISGLTSTLTLPLSRLRERECHCKFIHSAIALIRTGEIAI